MKEYIKPSIDVIVLQAEEAIANPNSGVLPKVKMNNGFGDGDHAAPGKSGEHNNAENAENHHGNGKGAINGIGNSKK